MGSNTVVAARASRTRRAARAVPPPPAVASVEAHALIGLARSLGYHLRELSESWTSALDQQASRHGVTVSQWRYLRELWEEDGLATGELTRRVGREGPTTVVAVRSLERSGLIRIGKSEHDRRKTYIFLTAAGRHLAERVLPNVGIVESLALEGLSASAIDSLKRAVVIIQRNLDRSLRARNAWAAARTEQLARDVSV